LTSRFGGSRAGGRGIQGARVEPRKKRGPDAGVALQNYNTKKKKARKSTRGPERVLKGEKNEKGTTNHPN